MHVLCVCDLALCDSQLFISSASSCAVLKMVVALKFAILYAVVHFFLIYALKGSPGQRENSCLDWLTEQGPSYFNLHLSKFAVCCVKESHVSGEVCIM